MVRAVRRNPMLLLLAVFALGAASLPLRAGAQPEPCAVDVEVVGAAAGDALAGATVRLSDPERFEARVQTDAKGHAHFAATSCEALRVPVSKKGYHAAHARLPAATPGRARSLTLRLAAVGRVGTIATSSAPKKKAT